MASSSLRSRVQRSPGAKRVALALMRAVSTFGSLRLSALPAWLRLLYDRTAYHRLGGQAPLLDLYPCLFDRTAATGFDAQYVYQAAWAARQIAQARTSKHVDIGSDIRFVSVLTAITEVVFVDIRPVALELKNFSCLPGSLLALPFGDRSVASLSCLHVIEHVGLGRYGDPLDPRGSDKAAREIARVVAPGGTAYLSAPIGRPRIQFNGQRIFSVAELIGLFPGLALAELSIVDATGRLHEGVRPDAVDLREDESGNDFGLGLFLFRREVLHDAG
jgi:SAM-dependent methyltransferase